MILAITDNGTEVDSGKSERYPVGVRHLSYEALHLILTGGIEPADTSPVADRVLRALSGRTAREMRLLATLRVSSRVRRPTGHSRSEHHGPLAAPLIADQRMMGIKVGTDRVARGCPWSPRHDSCHRPSR